jgi:hypothetical protein
MGLRLHSAIKYEVKYGDNGRFNYSQYYINNIIDTLAEQDCGYDGDHLDYAETLSADRNKLLANIDKILHPCEDWEYQEELNELLDEMDNDDDCECDREYVYTHLKAIIEQSDPNNIYAHFAWF